MSNETWKAENTIRYHFRISKNTGIPEALQKMTEKTGETDLQYIRRVVTESLIHDGFLKIKKHNTCNAPERAIKARGGADYQEDVNS